MTDPRILPAVLPSSVEADEVDLTDDFAADLLPEEAAAIAGARDERVREFAAGRYCARQAMGRLGVRGAAVLRGTDRAPVWPAGVVGSITHTRRRAVGWCGAAVARSAEVRSVGIDAEVDEPLDAKLWERVLTLAEQAWMALEPEAERGSWAKLVFGAKEAVYKCQYPLSRQYLEFADVEIADRPDAGVFRAALRRGAGPLGSGHCFEGRYVRRGGLIVSAVTLSSAVTLG